MLLGSAMFGWVALMVILPPRGKLVVLVIGGIVAGATALFG
jgi:hypothetical protein